MQDTNGSHEQDGVADIFNMQQYLTGVESAYKAPAPDHNTTDHT